MSPNLSLNSDLDDQLGQMLSQAALGEASEKLQSIKQDLMAKVNEQMGGEEAFLKTFFREEKWKDVDDCSNCGHS